MNLMTLQEISEYRNESLPCTLIDQATYVSTESMLADKRGITAISKTPNTGNVKKYYKHDVLVSNIRPYFKKVWLAEYDGTCSNDVLVFHSTGCLPNFLYLLLSSDAFFSYMTKTSKGTKMPRGDKRAIMKYEVKVPNLQAQFKICKIMDSLQSKIKINQRLNDYLAELGDILFLQALKKNRKEIKYRKIDSFCQVRGGKRLPKNSQLTSKPNAHPYIRVRDLNDATVLILTPEMLYVDNDIQMSISRYIVNTGDLIISVVGTIGLTSYIGKTLDGANLTENCNKLTSFEGDIASWVYFYFLSSLGLEAIRLETVGAVQIKLPLKNLKSIEVPFIPTYEMKKIVPVLNKIIKVIQENLIESLALTKLRDALLPKIMSGDIDIQNINIT